ncbi:MAG: glycerophosphoryl diester phosphodiesterase [Caulobacteraceae bacterium]|nr:glycerophosphoryl diester phosphodiesterase [Caulobacteraceae bacterium]
MRQLPGDKEHFGEAWERLFTPAFAHRGLWSPQGPPENSLAAFQAACAGGYGIELDVQLSGDGEAMVFHDETLERLTGAEGRLRDRSRADLAQLRLSGTEEPIPTLAEALVEIGHRAMVLVEIKTPFGHVGPLEERVCEVLLDHNGPSAILAFNPYVHQWFAQHHPQVLRGLNSYRWNDASAAKMAPEQRRAYAALEQVDIARPHFLSLSLDMIKSERAVALRREGRPLIGWTARSAEAFEAAKADCDNLIFEGFTA